MFNGGRLEYMNISDDEDEDVLAIGARVPLRPISNDRRSTESAALPTPPPSAGYRPYSAPTSLFNRSISPPSSNQSTDSVNCLGVRYPFPSISLQHGHYENDPNLSSSPSLPSLTPPAPDLATVQRQAAIDHFMSQINAGQLIQCLLCESKPKEPELLQHICDEHFFGYRPFKCRECDFRAGDRDVLLPHLLETNHLHGINNYEIIGERNENIEFVIRMIYTHSLYAHGKPEGARECILERMQEATRVLRARRQNIGQGGGVAAANPDEFESNTPAPILTPMAPIVTEPPLNGESMVTSSTSPLVPVPITHRQARKTIVRPVPSYIQPRVSFSPNQSGATSSTGSAGWTGMDQENTSGDKNSENGRQSIDQPPALLINPLTISPPPVLGPEISPSPLAPSPALVSPAVTPPMVKIQGAHCEFCNVTFPTLPSLKSHFRLDHVGGYFPYKCTQDGCDYGQWRERLVRMHVTEAHDVKTGKILVTKPTAEQKAHLEVAIQSLETKGAKESEVEDMKKYLTV